MGNMILMGNHGLYRHGATFNRPPFWTPSALGSALALWLDAADASTITPNGSTVSQWRDKSSNARHASQTTAANQPARTLAGLGGLPVLTFDGVNDSMNLSPVFAVGNAAANSLSVVALFRQSAVTTAARAVFWASSGSLGSSNTDYVLFSEQTGGDTAPSYRFGTGSAADTVAWQRIASPTVSTNPLIFSGVMAAATSSAGTKTSFIDGEQVATGSYATKGPAATSAAIGSQPGGTAPLAGTMAEVVITNTALSTADRQLLEGYLAWKWSGLISRPWTPADLGSSLALWLDADDASTITLNGSTVSQWRDKSGNNRHASQVTAANQPARTLNGLAGRAVVTFDGTNDWLGLSNSVFSNQLSWSFAAVAAKNNSTEPTCLFTERVASSNASIGVISASSSILSRAGGTDAVTVIEQTESVAFPVNAAQILGSVQTPTSGAAYRNGNLVASNSATKASLTFRALAIGGNQLNDSSPAAGQQWWPGPVGEVVITNTTLSTTNRQLLEGYLAWKWSNLL